MGFDKLLPFWGCDIWDWEADELVGKFEAGVGIGIHVAVIVQCLQ